MIPNRRPARGPLGRAAVLLLLALVPGCAPANEGTVEGKVTVRGKPAVGEFVTFFAAETGEGASAEIGPDGSFRLGAPLRVGTFVVTVVTPAPPPMAAPPPKRVTADPLRKYRRDETSDLRAAVAPGKNRFEFDLKP